MLRKLRFCEFAISLCILAFLPGVANSQCTADFSLPVNSCQFENVSFTFTGTATQPRFEWDFGDGFSNNNTDTVANPIHRYNREGKFSITLIISDGACTDTIVKTIRILKKPVAAFTADNTCAGISTIFTNTSAVDTPDQIRDYRWTFGDGGSSTATNPTHTYAGWGDRPVNLIVLTWNGCRDTFGIMLRTFDSLTLILNKDSVCKGDFVNFNMKVYTSMPGTFHWNFGDATGSYSQNTSHQYNTAGRFTPIATIYFSNGAKCVKPAADVVVNELPDAKFRILDSVQCFNYNSVCILTKLPASGLSYRSISFDDGFVDKVSPLSDSVVCYHYSDSVGGSYTLSMDIVDNNGCMASYTNPVKMVILPEITSFFRANKANGCFQTNFFATNASNMAPPKVTNFIWDFGDGSTNTTDWSSVSHTYTTDGVFDVSLIIENSNGCRDTFTRNDWVTNTSYPTDARLDSTLGVCRSDNMFQFRQTPIPQGTIYWDFGNLDTAFIYDPDYHYLRAGFYIPKVHLSKNGCPKVIVLDTVFVYGPQAAIGRIVNQYQCSIRDTVIFQNTSVYFRNKAVKFLWDMGDIYAPSCTTDSAKNINKGMNCRYSVDSTYVKHMYSPGREGCYFPRLIVTDTVVGCSDTAIARLPLMRPSADTGLAVIMRSLCLGPEPEKTVTLNLARTAPGCNQERFWVMWDSTCAAATPYFDSFWKFRELSHNYPYDICDSSGKITMGLIIQNGTDSSNKVCSDTAWYHHILDFGRVNPDFSSTYDPTKHYCKNTSFTFTVDDINQDSLAYINWNFGDGTAITVNSIAPVSHTFKRAGFFTVTLTLRLKDGCMARDTLIVRTGFQSSFSVSRREICSGDSITLNKSISYWGGGAQLWNDSNRAAAGLESVKWDFGDGNGFSSTSSFPTVFYNRIGDYNIRMAVTDSVGCRDTFSITRAARVFGIDVSFSTLRDTFACAQLINFKSNATVYDSVNNFGHNDDKVSKYFWSFGKGLSNSILKDPTKFFKAGTYTVKLLAENTRKCRDSFTKDITVLGPTAWFEFVGDSTGCQAHKVTFKNLSTFATSYTWNFKDNNSNSLFTTSDSNMIFSYPQYGNFYPTLTAFINVITNGLPVTCSNTYPDTSFGPAYRRVTVFENPKMQFTHRTNCNNFETDFTNTSFMNTDTIVRYEWDFGDGDTSMSFAPKHQFPDTGRYMVVLRGYSSLGCMGEFRKQVIIAPYPVVWFQKTNVCLGTPIHFKDSTEAFNDQIATWRWNFDDGTTSLLKNPIKTYTYDSTFRVSLTVTNYAGCISSDTITVRVHSRPKTNFTFANHCFSEAIPLTNTTTSKQNPLKYYWTLGDGDTSTKTSLNKLYDSSGNYSVKLRAVNPFGCDDSITKMVTTYPLPKAGFTINSHEQCQTGNRFNFTNTSTSDTGTLFQSWNFGDNSSSAIKNPTKTYTQPGSFSVTLIAITHYNCRDTAYDSLRVNPNPVTKPFLASALQCINSQMFRFIDSSKIFSGTYTRKWDLGDNTFSSNPTINHRYADTGNYSGSLVTLSNLNCPDTARFNVRVNPKPAASFTVNTPVQCQNTNNFVFTNTSTGYYGNTSSRWQFGDGDSSSVLQGIHHYVNYDTFNVRLIATNSTQCRDTAFQTVLVRPIPVTEFDINDSIACEKNNIFLFSNKTSIPYGSLQYRWDLGDGDSAFTQNTVHSYDTFGTYSVRLMAFSSDGCRDTVIHDVDVYPMPFASFTVNDNSQCLNDQDFIFTNTSSIARDTFYSLWLLGENDTLRTRNAQKQFTKDGLFRVMLKLTSDNGCEDSANMTVTVHPKPNPLFTVNDSTQCMNGQNFIFSNASTINKGSMTYQWELGNGTSNTSASFSYTYPAAGNYLVKLTALSDSGCMDSIFKPLQVFPKPVSSISANDSGQCINTNLFALHASANIPSGVVSSYYWSIDSGVYIKGSPDTSVRYKQFGLQGIGLIAESAEFCRDTSFLQVIIHPKPKTLFTINDTAQCVNDNLFTFTNQSTFAFGPLTYQWDFGNGVTDTASSRQKSFSKHDTLQVRLISSSAFLCSDTLISEIIIFPKPVPAFAISDTTQCLAGNRFTFSNTSTIPYGTLSYTWETGDGPTFSNLDTGYVYPNFGNYRVMLRVLSSEGCIDSAWKTNTVYPQPLAAFSVNKNRQCQNEQLFVFTNNSSIPSGSLTYEWDLGDGNIFDSLSVRHQYAQHGLKTIELKAVSSNQCRDSMTKTVRVLARPVTGITVNDSSQCVNVQKLLFSSTANIAEGTIKRFLWDFDDGTIDSGKNVTHFFNYSRFYTIKHTAISDSLCKDSITKVVRIFPKPVARFSVNDSAQCLRGNAYIFTDQSFDSFGISSLNWDMAGTKASTPVATHSFTDTGYKTIELVATSINGCTDTARRKVYVKNMPNPSFMTLLPFYCQFIPGVTILPTVPGGTFTGKNMNGNIYDPRILWKDTVKYVVTVNGCTDSSEQYTNVFPPPRINLGNDTQLCLYEYLNLNAKFWNSTYKWGNSAVTDTQFTVIRAGTYYVTVTNICGEDRDTITVTYSDHNCRFWMPNAFSPNGDDHNDYFKPYTINVPEVSMQIYNRWGEKVYDGNQDSPGWDGTYMGQPVQQEVYTWVVFYRYPLGNKHIQIKAKGTVQLLR